MKKHTFPGIENLGNLMTFETHIQRIRIFWTKESRGMPNAKRRNACTEEFAISDETVEKLLNGDVW